MRPSRREFLTTGLSAAALAYAGCTNAARNGAAASGLAPEDGSDLWLRYRQNPLARPFGRLACSSMDPAGSYGDILFPELRKAFGKENPAAVPVEFSVRPPLDDENLNTFGPESFSLRSGETGGKLSITLIAKGTAGALYGTFHLIRLLQTHAPIDNLRITQSPRLQLRLVNHWDNLDGTIERGYAGKSLWNWGELPEKLHPRLTAYARANASVGINGTVLNNLNASATFLSSAYLRKVAAIANVFRPWGIRVYLSANFSAPVILDKLPTADPLNPQVAAWWKNKADEIYGLIPDFGGFLVKANSEGQPGPQDFGRTHADGANMMADSLAPHRGNVIWRAFIYDENVDPDRAKRAYIEFTKLEGQFRPNVLLQVKNGPIDPARCAAINARLLIQGRDAARLWRDQILAYFQKINGLPIADCRIMRPFRIGKTVVALNLALFLRHSPTRALVK